MVSVATPAAWLWLPDPAWLCPGESSFGWRETHLCALIERDGRLWLAYDGRGLVTVALDGTAARAVVEHWVELPAR